MGKGLNSGGCSNCVVKSARSTPRFIHILVVGDKMVAYKIWRLCACRLTRRSFYIGEHIRMCTCLEIHTCVRRYGFSFSETEHT